MEEKILNSLLLRPGMEGRDVLLKDLIKDSIQDVKDYINYSLEEELPEQLKVIVQDVTLIKFNKIGAEGLQSESYSGVSQNYIDGLPKELKSRLRRYRRLP